MAMFWPSTPAEEIDAHDLLALTQILQMYAQGSIPESSAAPASASALPGSRTRPASAPSAETILKDLIETYGVSGGHEAAMRQSVTRLLPAWAKPETDDAGNLVLH